jgi:tRNA uridine 5-carbamoylmethylation protein Kti12
MCKKTIPGNHELCDEHRSILNFIIEDYNQNPEMQRRWDSVLELVKTKSNEATINNDLEDVIKFIDEIQAEFNEIS